MRRYRIAGLEVDSEFAFPNVASRASGGLDHDVCIEFLPEREPEGGWTAFFAGPRDDRRDLRLEPLPGLGFRVQAGNHIAIRRAAGITDVDVNIFLIGTVWGMLCHQRALLPLHCSAIQYRGQAFAFTGVSGAGKSTLAAGLARHGHAHFCDDVLVVDLAGLAPRAAATPKGLKLCEDALRFFSISPGQHVSTVNGMRKFHVPMESAALQESVPFGALYVLAYQAEDASPSITRITGRDYWSELYQSVYRVELVPWINSASAISRNVAALIGAVDVFRFTRSRGFDRYEEGLDMLERHVDEQSGRARQPEAAAIR